ncbi:MAG TPA: 3,4-dihydroxy-2-butanone-4-phosphate synthase [Candidatus Cybelea sp.]|nr:3,4-dihydroxy-2-butanone-4-phosphate synthase [Candidatus Cybelea sp.]
MTTAAASQSPSPQDLEIARESSRSLAHAATGTISVQVPGGAPVPIPAPAFELLRLALNEMAAGRGVSVLPVQSELTTQQAAELIGISRPHLVKLIEAGALPHRRVGTHRRVYLSDVVAYKQESGKGKETKRSPASQLDSIDDAIRAVARGEMVVVVDDEDRENEGDLVLAASKATPEQVAFMIRHTSGILCAAVTPERARTLRLTPMVHDNNAPLGTAFTISVDYREGLTTGIAASERTATVRALANGNVTADDFVRPGHVFPIVAKDGGVLVRSGHTEAATDLAALAGLPPVGLLAELVNDDGTVKRMPELVAFAREHRLKIVSISELIAYRRQRERLVHRVSEFEIATEIGPARAIAYATPFDKTQHLALVFGDIGSTSPVPVRIHREEVIADVFGRGGSSGAALLSRALAHIAKTGNGVVVYLREGAAGVASPSLSEQGGAPSYASRDQHWREIGIGAQILRDLGLGAITLLTTHQLGYVGLAGFGIRIAGIDRLDA